MATKPENYVKQAFNLTEEERRSYTEFISKHFPTEHEGVAEDFENVPGSRNLVLFHKGSVIGNFSYSTNHAHQIMHAAPPRSYVAEHGSPALELLLHAKEIDFLKHMPVSGFSGSGARFFKKLEENSLVKVKKLSGRQVFQVDAMEGGMGATHVVTFTPKGQAMKPKFQLVKR